VRGWRGHRHPSGLEATVLQLSAEPLDTVTPWIPTDFTPQEYEASIPKLRAQLNRLGRAPSSLEICSHLALIVDNDKSRAHELAAKIASDFGEKPEEFEGYALVGDPSSIAERIAQYTALGVRHHVLSTFLTESKNTLLPHASPLLRRGYAKCVILN